MKILMVVTYYEPHISGLTIYVERVGEELARRGHSVTVMTSRHLPDLPLREEIRGVSVVRIPVASRVNKGVIVPSMPLEAWRQVRSHDVVHMHLPLAGAAYIASVASVPPRRKAIITYHCEIQLPRSPFAGVITAGLTASHHIAGSQVDAIVTYTRDYARHSMFLRHYPDKVRTVYPPIVIEPPVRARAAEWRRELGLADAKVVGFAGRFSEDKGGNYLLESIPLLLKQVPEARYVFAGEYRRVIGENFFDKVKPLIDRHKDHILFLGELRGQRLTDFYTMCDVLTLPSVNSTESFGMVQVEAMLCGTPVVASDIPGVREATRVSGMGMAVPPRDPAALADALAEVLLRGEKYSRPKIDLARAFGIAQNVDFYERLYGVPGTK